MQIDESFELPFNRETVWQAFHNIKLLVECLPGAQLISDVEQSPLELAFQVKLGPITAGFIGQGAVDYDSTNFVGNFSGQGTDRKSNSRVKGQARFALIESAKSSTSVNVSVEFSLTGALAQFGRIGIVKEIASGITAQFATNLKRKLVPEPSELLEASPEVPSMDAAPSLNLGNLFWQLVKQRLRQFFKWI